MRSSRTAAAATALLTLTLLAGCGGGDDDKKSSDTETVTVTETPSATDSSSAPTSTAPTTPESPMDPTDGDITQDQVDAALLTPEEVGSDFVLGTYTDTDDPPLCDATATPLDEQVPPQLQGGTEIDHTSGNAAMLEEITIYPTEDDAQNAFDIGTSGISCDQGTTSDGTTVDISAPQDVTDQVNSASGLGSSTAWVITNDQLQAQLVVTLAGRVLVTTTFQATADFDTTTLPDPVAVATQAFAKALAN